MNLYVERSALTRQAVVLREARRDVAELRDRLREAFDRDRRTLGDDDYGAELAKQLPEIEKGIFDAFQAYIDQFDTTSESLVAGVARYDSGEQQSTIAT